MDWNEPPSSLNSTEYHQFQYPLRVEMDWNPTFNPPSSMMLTFQYPLRVEMDWNGNVRRLCACPIMFQYPLRVEMDWNIDDPGDPFGEVAGFSTLCGSKWIGTNAPCRPPTTQLQFQYPLRVEMDWNLLAYRHIPPGRGFSTLCGSKWIGTPCGSRDRAPSSCVSVPSAGRNGLELTMTAFRSRISNVFQYPLRVEMDWN